jgi:hypothetical protein
LFADERVGKTKKIKYPEMYYSIGKRERAFFMIAAAFLFE